MIKQPVGKRQIDVHFPLGGLNRRGAYRQQPPYTTPSCLNVRAIGSMDGRERGGSRPGLIESHIDIIGDGEPIRLLSPMVIALGDGFTAWSDTFSGTSMAEAWTQASWATAMPSILPSALASIDYTTAEGEAILDVLPIDTAHNYSVEIFLTPWIGAWHGKYRLYLRLNDTTPDIAVDGVVVELVMSGTTGSYTGTLTSVSGGVSTVYQLTAGTLGVARPGWLTAEVSSDTITVYWNGVLLLAQAVSAHTGTRVGFGLECTVDGGLALANVFRVQYFSTASVSVLRSMLIASAFTSLYYESTYSRLTEVDSDVSVRDDVPLTAAQSGQKLYIADYGDVSAFDTDGAVSGTALTATGITDWRFSGIDTSDHVVVISNVTGTAVAGTYEITAINEESITLSSTAGAGNCTYRIERAPKVYDPLTNIISILYATTGQVPTGCPIIWRFLNRIFLAGAEIAPHVWYCCRSGEETDWDYSQEDSQRAVAGTASEAGVPGDPITAGLSHSDDYAIIACRNSLWRMQGDPAFGGSLAAISHTVGIIGPKAWCLGPAGELVFLSLDGIYVLPPGGNTYPVPLSREMLPHEFLNLNPDILSVSLEYDVQGRGIHIYLTPESSNARVHWWMDWERKTFWPLSLDADHEPTATCAIQAVAIEESGVILGGRDGKLRCLSDLAETDCGEVYETYVIMGPIALARDSQVGTVLSMDAVIAEGSGNIIWTFQPSLTFEGVMNATVSDTGTWVAGLNSTNYPACRGQACNLKLTGISGRKWEVEQITAVLKDAGRRRIP